MYHQLIEITLPFEDTKQASEIYSLALAQARIAQYGSITLRFTDMDSLDAFTQYLEYEQGYVYKMERDDLSRLGFDYERESVASFSFCPGYSLAAECSVPN